VIFAVSPIVGPLGPLGVVPVVVLLPPAAFGVVLVTVALFVRLPVEPFETTPVSLIVYELPFGMSLRVVLPVQLACGIVVPFGAVTVKR
jgi:hypothetical protein